MFCKGGGLDPLFYIPSINLVHLAMPQLGVGVPVCVPPSAKKIASLGYVDDTVGFSSIDDGQRVADHLRIIIDCVGQHNNSSKMHPHTSSQGRFALECQQIDCLGR